MNAPNTLPTSILNIDPAPIKVDPVYIATQFERLNVTLEFFGKSLDRANDKADAQDRLIDGLVADMGVVKNDLENMKEQKPPKMHPMVMASSVGALIISAIAFITLVFQSMTGG